MLYISTPWTDCRVSATLPLTLDTHTPWPLLYIGWKGLNLMLKTHTPWPPLDMGTP